MKSVMSKSELADGLLWVVESSRRLVKIRPQDADEMFGAIHQVVSVLRDRIKQDANIAQTSAPSVDDQDASEKIFNINEIILVSILLAKRNEH
jgi:hypothetical protein